MALPALFSFFGKTPAKAAISGVREDTTKLPHNFSYDKPVFRLHGEQLSNANANLHYTVLTGYRDSVDVVNGGFYNYMTDEPMPGVSRFYLYNLSVVEMIKRDPFINKNRVILEVRDPSKYQFDPSYGPLAAWLKKNAHCYEVILPKAVMSETVVDSLMAHDLGVHFYKEKRPAKVWVIKRTSDQQKYKASGSEGAGQGLNGHFKNGAFRYVGARMEAAGTIPVVDETGISEPVDMELGISNYADIPGLRKALQRYDLDILPGTREMEMLVIKENK